MCRCGSLMEESDLVALTPLQHVWPYCVHNLLHHHQNHHKNHHHNHHHNHHQNHHHRQMYEDWCCVTHKKLSVHPCYCFNFIAIGKTCQVQNCFPFFLLQLPKIPLLGRCLHGNGRFCPIDQISGHLVPPTCHCQFLLDCSPASQTKEYSPFLASFTLIGF